MSNHLEILHTVKSHRVTVYYFEYSRLTKKWTLLFINQSLFIMKGNIKTVFNLMFV